MLGKRSDLIVLTFQFNKNDWFIRLVQYTAKEDGFPPYLPASSIIQYVLMFFYCTKFSVIFKLH